MGDARIVVNASPLILLAKIDATSLLTVIASAVVTPATVEAEIRAGLAAPQEFGQLFPGEWLRVVDDLPLSPEIVEWDLGAGESQVLAFANENPGWEAALDDLDARRCADSLGIPLTGTLGVILRAKREGKIPAALPYVERLVATGAHLSESLIETALSLVGEAWTGGRA